MKHTITVGSEIVPGYMLVRVLGSGGFGVVWEATSPGDIPVALKVIQIRGTRTGQRELQSLELLRTLRHAHLLPIHAFWLLDGQGNPTGNPEEAELLVIAMMMADKNLMQRLEECRAEGRQGIDQKELLEYMREAAKGIDFLNSPTHRLGESVVAIQHRDIKPENLLLVGDSVMVADFGIAKALVPDAKHSTSRSMTISYAPPELFEGKACAWTDQYSLAIAYYELRTGTLPFHGSTSPYTIMQHHFKGTHNFSDVDADEEKVLRRATTPEPTKRFANCSEFVIALYRSVEGGTTETNLPPAARTKIETAVVEDRPASPFTRTELSGSSMRLPLASRPLRSWQRAAVWIAAAVTLLMVGFSAARWTWNRFAPTPSGYELAFAANPELFATLGESQIDEKSLEQMIESLRERGSGLSAKEWNALGLAYLRLGKYDDSFHAFDEACTLEPNRPEPLVNKVLAGLPLRATVPNDTLNMIVNDAARLARDDKLMLAAADFVSGSIAARDAKINDVFQDKTALQRFSRAVQNDPANPIFLVARGRELARAGSWGEAESDAKQALKLNADFAGAHVLNGMVFEHRKLPQKALDAYRQAVTLNSSPAAPRLQLGRLLWRTGDAKSAVEQMAEYMRRHGDDADSLAWLIQGCSFERMGERSKAFDSLGKVRVEDLSESADQLAYAWSMVRLDKSDEAKRVAVLVHDADPTLASASLLLARLELQSGDVEAANGFAAEAVEAMDSLPIEEEVELHAVRSAILRRKGEFAEAIAELEQAQRLSKDDARRFAELTTDLVAACIELARDRLFSDPAEAERQLDRAADLGRDVATERAELAGAFAAQAVRVAATDPKAAVALYDKALKYRSDDSKFLIGQGRLLLDAKLDADAALKNADRVLMTDPGDHAALRLRADALHEASQWDSASQAWLALLRLVPNDAEVLAKLDAAARKRREAGNTDELLALLRESHKLKPDTFREILADSLVAMAETALKRPDLAAARRHAEEAIALDPSRAMAHFIVARSITDSKPTRNEDLEAAEKKLGEAIQRERRRDWLLLRAEIRDKLKKEQEADDDRRAAKDAAIVQRDMGLQLLADKEFEQAAVAFDGVISEKRKKAEEPSKDDFANRGQAYLLLAEQGGDPEKNFDKAALDFASIGDRSQGARAWAGLGRWRLKNGKSQELAADALEHSRQLNARDPSVLLDLSELQAQLGKTKDAITCAESALQTMQSTGGTAADRARATRVVGLGLHRELDKLTPADAERAEKALGDAAAQNPKDGPVQAALGDVLARIGLPRKAAEAYQRAIALSDNDAALKLKAADALLRAAEQLLDEKKAADAQGELKAAAEYAGDDKALRGRLAVAWHAAARQVPESARPEFVQAFRAAAEDIARRWDEGNGWYLAGEAQSMAADYVAAATSFRKALRNDDESDAAANIRIGLATAEFQIASRADDATEQAAQFKQAAADAEIAAAIFAKNGRHNDAARATYQAARAVVAAANVLEKIGSQPKQLEEADAQALKLLDAAVRDATTLNIDESAKWEAELESFRSLPRVEGRAAEPEIRTRLKSDPSNADLLLRLANIEEQSAKKDDARRHFVFGYNRRAWSLARAGKLDEADAAVREAAAKDSEHALVEHARGIIALESEKIQESIQFFGTAIERGGDSEAERWRFYADRSAAYIQRGHLPIGTRADFEAAVQDARLALEVYPTRPQPPAANERPAKTHREYAELHYALGNALEDVANSGKTEAELAGFAAANAEFELAMRLDATDARYVTATGRNLAKRAAFLRLALNRAGDAQLDADVRRVEELFAASLELNPKLAETHNVLGDFHRWRKQWPKARGAYADAVKYSLDDPLERKNTHLYADNLAATLHRLQAYKEVIAATDQAIQAKSDDYVAYYWRAMALSNLRPSLEKKDSKDTLDAFEKALEFNPKHIPSMAGRARTVWECKDATDVERQKARVLIEQAIAASDSPATPSDQRADAVYARSVMYLKMHLIYTATPSDRPKAEAALVACERDVLNVVQLMPEASEYMKTATLIFNHAVDYPWSDAKLATQSKSVIQDWQDWKQRK